LSFVKVPANRQATHPSAVHVLYSGVACITDLIVKEGFINLGFADVRIVMHEMGSAIMGSGETYGEGRALRSAEATIANPLARRALNTDIDHLRQAPYP
jgi:cell division protein FtsZ